MSKKRKKPIKKPKEVSPIPPSEPTREEFSKLLDSMPISNGTLYWL